MNFVFKSLFINNRFFYGLTIIITLFIVGFFIPIIFTLSKTLLFILLELTFIDFILLYTNKNGFEISRILPERLSNGDQNRISLQLTNNYGFKTFSTLIEELPFQFQKRDFIFSQKLNKKEEKSIFYNLKPTERGLYNFGHINLYVSSPLQLVTKKYILCEEKEIKCYPSFLQLNELSNKAFSNLLTIGNRKIRRVGHSLEFEQIKDYVSGDDIRTLNWKATAKRNQLMVNQYVEEKSQSVYSIIDKGRVMQFNFNGLTLLDYAVNATLAVSSIVLKKHDKAGMFSFSKKIEDLIVAEQRNSQMNLISEALYNTTTDFSESDYSKLYASVRRKITHRSLLILYTNFETLDSLNRQLSYLRALAKNHLLLVVFFKNTELEKISLQKVKNAKDVYDKIIAEKFIHEKIQIVNELRKYGIQSILTKPEHLTSDTISKYLELKSLGIF